jgi:hypothetical protein
MFHPHWRLGERSASHSVQSPHFPHGWWACGFLQIRRPEGLAMIRKKASSPVKVSSEIDIAKIPLDEIRRTVTKAVAGSGLAATRVMLATEKTTGYGQDIDIAELGSCLLDQAQAVNRGDMKQVEAMLMHQATALQSLFVRLTERGYELRPDTRIRGEYPHGASGTESVPYHARNARRNQESPGGLRETGECHYRAAANQQWRAGTVAGARNCNRPNPTIKGKL